MTKTEQKKLQQKKRHRHKSYRILFSVLFMITMGVLSYRFYQINFYARTTATVIQCERDMIGFHMTKGGNQAQWGMALDIAYTVNGKTIYSEMLSSACPMLNPGDTVEIFYHKKNLKKCSFIQQK